MINFELKLDYKNSEDDDMYREQFLTFFLISSYNENIIREKQDSIYEQLKDDNIFKEIIVKLENKHSYDHDIAYIMLYSFDYFDIFSEVIKLLLYYKNKEVMYESLQKELVHLKDQI